MLDGIEDLLSIGRMRLDQVDKYELIDRKKDVMKCNRKEDVSKGIMSNKNNNSIDGNMDTNKIGIGNMDGNVPSFDNGDMA